MESPETRDRKKISIFWKRQRWRLSQCFKKYPYHKQIPLLFIIDSIFCTFKRDLEGNGVYWITRNRFMCTSCCFRERKIEELIQDSHFGREEYDIFQGQMPLPLELRNERGAGYITYNNKNSCFATAVPPYSDLTARKGIDVPSNGWVYRSGDIYLVNGGPQRPASIL